MSLNFRSYAFIMYLIHNVLSQGSIQLTFSSNPVYSGESATLLFTYGSGLQLLQLTVDAFNETLKKGFLFYKATPANSTGVGVFDGKSLNGWPNIPVGVTSVSVTLTVTPSLELYYNCTVVVVDGSVPPVSSVLTSSPSFLRVWVLPSPPILSPNITTFNQSDIATITCASPNGKPAADLLLTVSMSNGTTVATKGIDSSSLVLSSPPIDWHNATATCNVTNHNNPSMTITTIVMINHIRITAVPDVIYTFASGVTLNCSTYIRSYPGALYRWRVPIGANATANLVPSNEWFHVLQRQSGLFNCTATNVITMEHVTIVFIVSNMPSLTSGPMSHEEAQKDEPLWVIGLVLGVIAVVTIAVTLVVLRKRGHYSKGKKEPNVKHINPDQRSNVGNIRGRRKLDDREAESRRNFFQGTLTSEKRHVANSYVPSDDKNYESLNAQPSNEPAYTQLTEAQRLDDIAAYENVESTKRAYVT